jgi:hypothetical protein
MQSPAHARPIPWGETGASPYRIDSSIPNAVMPCFGNTEYRATRRFRATRIVTQFHYSNYR